MSHKGLLDSVKEITGDELKAYKAIAAAFFGQLDLSLPLENDGFPVTFTLEAFVHKPPPVTPSVTLVRRKLANTSELIAFIAESAEISKDAAGKVLGLVTESFVAKSYEAGLLYSPDDDAC